MIGLIQKCLWLVQTISRSGDSGISFEDIQYKWEKKWGELYPRRSFYNHRQMIEDCFGIRISVRKGENLYRVDKDYGDEEGSQAFRWMMDTMAMNSLAELKKDELKGRVALEDAPQGRGDLIAISGAMQDNVKIRISYQKYTSNEASLYTIRPYALKEYSRRWYLIGYCEERSSVRVYALDRILSLQPTLESFGMPENFDVDELFAGCYGVYLPDEGSRREVIRFRTTAREAKYLKSLPIHPTQQIIAQDATHTTFEIFVYMNEDLKMNFLSRGCTIEILSPESLRDTLREELTKASKQYD